ncbi:MAG: glycosyltransferase family 4 protein [Solirubrobacteraceae bacterium]
MSRPLRFCMASTFYPPWSFGGDAIQVRRLAHALADRGHEVTVVHSREGYRSMAGAPPKDAEASRHGVRVVGIDAGLGALSPLATYLTGRPLLAGRRLAAALDEPFDVVHFHNPSLLGGPEALALGTGIKLYTAHEQWLVCPTHVLWKYQQRVCEKPDCWRCTLSYRRPPQLWRSTSLLERSLSHLDALICPSRASERLHERFSSVVRIERLGHFIADPSVGDHRERAERPGRPYFLFAGRLESIKGVEEIIEAFRRRTEEDLLIAGEGTLEATLRAQAADLPHVRFLGWRSGDDLHALYRDALAVLVPTAGHEAFGLVALEAFARETPVVARRFGALAELLEESGGGLSFTTAFELDAALDRIAAEPDLRAHLAREGRTAYERRFTEREHIGRYLALVGELAERRGRGELAAIARGGAEAELAGAGA